MKEIIIPFRTEFKDRMLSGQKIMTSRTKKYGELGDCFEAFGRCFVLRAVFKERLARVAHAYFSQEGFTSVAEFIYCWSKLHPRKGFAPWQDVWCHRFELEASNGRDNKEH